MILRIGSPYLDRKSVNRRVPDHIFTVASGPEPGNVCVSRLVRVTTADPSEAWRAQKAFAAEHAAEIHPEAVVSEPKVL